MQRSESQATNVAFKALDSFSVLSGAIAPRNGAQSSGAKPSLAG